MGAAAEAMFPPNPLGAPDWQQTRMVERTAEYLRALPPATRNLILALFILIELGQPLLSRRFRRFSRLPLEVRTRVIRGWRASGLYPLRVVGDSLKALLTMMYMSHGEVLRYAGLYAMAPRAWDALELPVKIGALREEGR